MSVSPSCSSGEEMEFFKNIQHNLRNFQEFFNIFQSLKFKLTLVLVWIEALYFSMKKSTYGSEDNRLGVMD